MTTTLPPVSAAGASRPRPPLLRSARTRFGLAACVAALSFAACDEQKQPVPTPKPAPIAVVAPKPAPVVAVAPEPVKPPEPADVLMLKHDEARIDHLARAKGLKSEGDLSGALTEARRALYSHPADEETLTFIGNLTTKTGQHALAAEAYARIGLIRADDATPMVQRARALVKAKAFTESTLAAKEAIKRDSGNPEAYQAAGLGHLAVGELQDAITMFSKVVELKPDHGWALNNLGLAYLRANENEKAVEVLQKAADLLPNTAYVHNNLGVALERTGRTDEANQAYLTSTTLSPKYVKARINAERIARAKTEAGTDTDIGSDPEFEKEAPDTAPEN